MQLNPHLFVLHRGTSGSGIREESAVEHNSSEFVEERGSASNVPGPAGQALQFELAAEGKQKWEQWRDDQIKLAVLTALHWDLAVPRDRVHVSVNRGWVTLSGRVGREYERSSAEADARVTRGVTGVTNAIRCRAAE
jgi:osmotically-inducible protein OsmY